MKIDSINDLYNNQNRKIKNGGYLKYYQNQWDSKYDGLLTEVKCKILNNIFQFRYGDFGVFRGSYFDCLHLTLEVFLDGLQKYHPDDIETFINYLIDKDALPGYNIAYCHTPTYHALAFVDKNDFEHLVQMHGMEQNRHILLSYLLNNYAFPERSKPIEVFKFLK